MRIGIIGAGVTGLVTAYRLAEEGHDVTVYERWPGLGGQAATIDVGGGHRLERYYHHLFTSDVHISSLYEELGMADDLGEFPSRVAFLVDGEIHPFNGPTDLLRFSPLSLTSRLRVGLAVLYLQTLRRSIEPLEGVTAEAWIRSRMGEAAWESLWGPLLRGKFGSRAGDITMGWIWCKLNVRRSIDREQLGQEHLIYPVESWEPLFARLQEEIEKRGGRVLLNRPAASIERVGDGFAVTPGAAESFRTGHDPSRFPTTDEADVHDVVVATVPNDVFERLLSDQLRCEIGHRYLNSLHSIEYHTAMCLLIELREQLTDHYWINVADRSLPFVGLIEHTNLMGAERYDGRRFMYVANYFEQDHPMLDLDADEALDLYLPGLQTANPRFDKSWVVDRWLHTEPAAQPIVDVGYRDRIPALKTPADGLFLANTTQVYPEDRGTNYAVRLGNQVAQTVGEKS